MDNSYYYDDSASGIVGFIWLVMIAVLIVNAIALWKVYKKAGYQGWECLVPFYSWYVLSDIVFGNGLYFLIMFVPFIGQFFSLVVFFKLAEVFNKSSGFGIGLVLLSPVFLIMLGFDGNAYYSGPSVKARAMTGGVYGSYGGGSYGAGGYGVSPYNGGYNNDYQTYGGNNPQGYGTGNQQQGFQAQGTFQSQNNGYQNNGFQAQGQPQPKQEVNPFEQPNGNNYYGNNSNYNSYNNQNNNDF